MRCGAWSTERRPPRGWPWRDRTDTALHRTFESPREKIVLDVGHQAYPHKLLTGRRDRFATIRQAGGLAPFLSRDESEHDAFGAGHASTSISAALGMAAANELHGAASRSWR